MKFDDTKKVAVIKEIKSIIEGLNLVQVRQLLMFLTNYEYKFYKNNDFLAKFNLSVLSALLVLVLFHIF